MVGGSENGNFPLNIKCVMYWKCPSVVQKSPQTTLHNTSSCFLIILEKIRFGNFQSSILNQTRFISMKQCYNMKLWVNIYNRWIESWGIIRRPQKFNKIFQLTWNLPIKYFVKFFGAFLQNFNCSSLQLHNWGYTTSPSSIYSCSIGHILDHDFCHLGCWAVKEKFLKRRNFC